MWLIVMFSLICLGALMWYVGDKQYWEALNLCGIATTLIATVVFIGMLFIVLIAHTDVEGYLEANRERYDALVYKVESTTCRDEFGFLNKEVIDEVQEWNESVRANKARQKDLWVGIFYPNIYDEFETIDYNQFVTK